MFEITHLPFLWLLDRRNIVEIGPLHRGVLSKVVDEDFIRRRGLAQVRRQDRRAELLSLRGRAPVMHAGLLHRDLADARGDGPLGHVAVANHLPLAGRIATVLVPLDSVGDLGLDGLGEQLLRALAENIAQDILGLGQWHDPNIAGRTIHGGVLLCRLGTLVTVDTPRVRRLLSSAINNIRP